MQCYTELLNRSDSWLWLVPQCIHLIIASYISSPIDLYVYICTAYFTHCHTHDPGGLGGSAVVLSAQHTHRVSYCDNANEWEWIGAMRQELGARVQSTIQEALTSMHAGFLQGCLERWNDVSHPLGSSQIGAKVLLAGSVPLCAITGITLSEHTSDLDLFVSNSAFRQVESDLKKMRFKAIYNSSAHNYAGVFKWRLYRFQRSFPPTDKVGIDVVRINSDCIDQAGCIRPDQLAASFDLSGCAVTYDGRSTVIPAPEDTLGFRLILRKPYVSAFEQLPRIPHGINPSTCSAIVGLINDSIARDFCPTVRVPKNPHMNEYRLVMAVAWTLYMLRKVIERIIKYRRRGFKVVGSPFHDGLALIDISVRIEEFIHSYIYRRCEDDMPYWYWIDGLKQPSTYLRHFIFDFCATMSKLTWSHGYIMVLTEDHAEGPDARAASRVYRFYLHTRLLSYVKAYVFGRMYGRRTFASPSLRESHCFQYAVSWHRRQVLKAYRRLSISERNQIRYLIDWKWLLANADDEESQLSQRRRLVVERQLECKLVGAREGGSRPSRVSQGLERI